MHEPAGDQSVLSGGGQFSPAPVLGVGLAGRDTQAKVRAVQDQHPVVVPGCGGPGRVELAQRVREQVAVRLLQLEPAAIAWPVTAGDGPAGCQGCKGVGGGGAVFLRP